MARELKIQSQLGNGQTPGYYREVQPAMVDVKSEESLQRWSRVLHLSPDELLEAVAEFGPLVKHIRLGLAARANTHDEAA